MSVPCETAGGDGVLRVAVEFARHGNLRDLLRRNRPVSSTTSQCQRCIDELSALSPGPGPTGSHKVPLTSRQLLSFAHQTARGMQFLASNKVHFIITSRQRQPFIILKLL